MAQDIGVDAVLVTGGFGKTVDLFGSELRHRLYRGSGNTRWLGSVRWSGGDFDSLGKNLAVFNMPEAKKFCF